MSLTVLAACPQCGDVTASIDRCVMSFPLYTSDVVVSFWDDEEHPVSKRITPDLHPDTIRTLVEAGIPFDLGDVDAELAG